MKIIKYARYFVYLLPVALAALVVLMVLGSKQSIPSRVREGLQGLVRRVPAIILLTVLYAGLFVGVNLMRSWTEARTVIGFNYKEASQGLNPNGTRFNTYDIISDEVLEEAIQRLDTDLSIRQLRSTLSVYPLAAGGSLSAERYYISTEYVLSYSANLKTIMLDPRKTVDTVAEVYNEQFQETYSRNTDILSVDLALVDAADYLDKPGLMGEMASEIQEYMQGCQLDDPSFRSSSGENFGDVGTRAGKFKSITLERLRAYILSNGISKDPEQYISRLNYDNTIKSISYRKNLAAYEVRLNAIDLYERDLASIVLVPTRDEAGEFYMGRTKIGVDNFAEEAESFIQNATDLQEVIETNNYEIAQLRQGGGDRTAVDQLLEAAKQELKGVEESARQIVKEYDEANTKDILVITPQGRSIKAMLRTKRGIVLTAGFLVMLTALFIVYPWQTKTRNRNELIPLDYPYRQTGRI
ncbi:MAG: hypothetical protein HFE83_13565 [Lachnospiraceae bacterium]|nr:hypothetical protein [Lachnospiraceae bacterium]